MELRNIGLIYKGVKITLIKELHIVATPKGVKRTAVRVIYSEPGKAETTVLSGNIKDFCFFDKSKDNTDT